MEIKKSTIDGSIILAPVGKMDTNTSAEVGAALDAALDEANHIVLDFAELNYLSSAGLRVLVAAQKKLNASQGTLLIRNVSEIIMEVFEVTGLEDVLTIEKG